MELAQLKYFQVMANIRHFTRAARMLDVTQPALSRSMAKLEKDLGVPLFKRSEGEIELTPEGERLLRRVDRILREVDSAREEASNAHAEVSKEFRLSFIHSLGSYALPHILQDFRALYPDIRIQLNQQDSAALALQVAAGETDLCLCSTIPTTEYSAWVYLWSEELFVTVPLGHRFAEREKINLHELEDEPLVAMKSSCRNPSRDHVRGGRRVDDLGACRGRAWRQSAAEARRRRTSGAALYPCFIPDLQACGRHRMEHTAAAPPCRHLFPAVSDPPL